jgi:hypothetical protein
MQLSREIITIPRVNHSEEPITVNLRIIIFEHLWQVLTDHLMTLGIVPNVLQSERLESRDIHWSDLFVLVDLDFARKNTSHVGHVTVALVRNEELAYKCTQLRLILASSYLPLTPRIQRSCYFDCTFFENSPIVIFFEGELSF